MNAEPRTGRLSPHLLSLALLLGVVLVWGLLMVVALSDSPEDGGEVVVLFAPGVPAQEHYFAIAGAGGMGRPLGVDYLWRARGLEAGFAEQLRRRGALVVLPVPREVWSAPLSCF